MTEQQLDRDRLGRRAEAGHTVFLHPDETLALFDTAESRIEAVVTVLDRADADKASRGWQGSSVLLISKVRRALEG